MVRAFIGIVIPEDIKRYIIDIQKTIRLLTIKAKFVEKGNLHISLSFLGDIENEEIERIKLKLDETTLAQKKFTFTLGGITLIPSEKFTRVIALDVANETLESLRKDIVKNIGGKSYPVHLTLARISIVEDREKFVESIKNIPTKKLVVEVDSVYLFESVLRRGGPIYTILQRSYLK